MVMMILKNGDDKVDVKGWGFKIQGRRGIACALCVVVIIINKVTGKVAVKEKDGDCEEGL